MTSITQGANSLLCNPNEYMDFVNAIKSMDEEIKDKFSELNIIESKKYNVKQINKIRIIKIYSKGEEYD